MTHLQVTTFKAPPFFTFHTANAYEEAGVVHVDFCGYEDPEVRGGGFKEAMPEAMQVPACCLTLSR
jgi:carotenoid cleavage dioxygenase-like enzyme